MSRSRWVGIVRILSLALFVLSSVSASVEAAEKKGFKKRIKKTLGIKEKSPEQNMHQVGEVPPVDPKKPSQGAVRDVFLITEPTNKANIAPGATIAFIDFKHIANEIPEFWATYERVESRSSRGVSDDERHLDYESFPDHGRYQVRTEVYNSNICARQVESALAQHLADLNQFKVVTRDQIENVLKEQNFNFSGRVNTRTASRLGEIIGADVLIFGQVQLCVSSRQDYESIARLVSQGDGALERDSKGFFNFLSQAFSTVKPEKLRAFVLAQIQMIDAETGKRVFTTSISGEFVDRTNVFSGEMKHRELVHRAADQLANRFIDDLLARQEERYLGLYIDPTWEFKPGVDWVQLGQCGLAEQYFSSLYPKFKGKMKERDIARLMYNHGVALMCSNRPEEAADRLWASLRLANEERTFEAIGFTNDTVDRGRRVQAEDDEIIRDVVNRLYSEIPWQTAEDIGIRTSVTLPETEGNR